MLTINQYGITLKRITESDIEMIRYWRNQKNVAGYMEYNNYITPSSQQQWFHTVNNPFNYYFIIESEHKKIGLINVKNYDRDLGFGEGGIFIWDTDYIGSFAAVCSSLCLLNFMFVKVNVCSISRIRILKTNERAVYYNHTLGYQLLPGQDNITNQLYELRIDEYIRRSHKLHKAACALSGTDGKLSYKGETSVKNIDEINRLLNP